MSREQRRFSSRNGSTFPGKHPIGNPAPEALMKLVNAAETAMDQNNVDHPVVVERTLNPVEEEMRKEALSFLEAYYTAIGIKTPPLNCAVFITEFESNTNRQAKPDQEPEDINELMHSSNAIEEGLSVLLQHRFLRQLLKKSKRFNGLATELASFYSPIAPRESITFIDDEDRFSANSFYTDSVQLVLFLMEYIDDFEILFQRAHIEEGQKKLWFAINDLFGTGAAALVSEARGETALDTIGALTARLAELDGDDSALQYHLHLREKIVAARHEYSDNTPTVDLNNQSTVARPLTGTCHTDIYTGSNIVYITPPRMLETGKITEIERINWTTTLAHEIHHSTARIHYRLDPKEDGLHIGMKNIGTRFDDSYYPSRARRIRRVQEELDSFRATHC